MEYRPLDNVRLGTLINFVQENSRANILFCTADINYLNSLFGGYTNIIKGSEFTFKESLYAIDNLLWSFANNDGYGNELDMDTYFGKPSKYNFELYLNVVKKS